MQSNLIITRLGRNHTASTREYVHRVQFVIRLLIEQTHNLPPFMTLLSTPHKSRSPPKREETLACLERVMETKMGTISRLFGFHTIVLVLIPGCQAQSPCILSTLKWQLDDYPHTLRRFSSWSNWCIQGGLCHSLTSASEEVQRTSSSTHISHSVNSKPKFSMSTRTQHNHMLLQWLRWFCASE